MGNVIGKSSKGAVIGGIAGLVLPGVGTLIGASVGATLGALTGDATLKEHIDAWYAYRKADITPSEEDGWILAGREAEDLLLTMVEKHYQFRGSHFFVGKRIYNPAVNHKHEIDMIVVTDRKLYVLECKNWSGRLVIRNGSWVQEKTTQEGVRETVHSDVLRHNTMKRDLLVATLKEEGIDVSAQDCVQKVIFMNRNLKIEDHEISEHPDVVTPDRLDAYLDSEDSSMEPYQRLFASIMSLLLDSESSGKLIDGIFSRIGGKDHERLLSFLRELPTWDRIHLYGTRVLVGDIIHNTIYQSAYKVPFEKIRKIKVRIARKSGVFLAKSLLRIGRPIGLDLFDQKGRCLLKTRGNPEGVISFIPAGKPNPVEVPLLMIEEIHLGKQGG